ncbi:hypothetical protein SAMN05660836_00163 [Thermodesulforhabdus norvegica]|uniref:Uncharacterized protein n=1 Tax=Thermodesulforhabdus norvegica TaxID=39841 RepID=A0A1I4QQC0_9BACT|nr:hypothetical protein [Thermodesulforhabdus norvegica]SFM42221.1 hypothetical protein SAMN05660836_00163 [Thermodesulforhabdus norvegica]
MNDVERLVDFQRLLKSGPAVVVKVFVIAKQQEAAPFESFFVKNIQFPPVITSKLIDGLIRHSHHMVAIENPGNVRKDFTNGPDAGTVHVHSDCPQLLGLSFQGMQERADGLPALALNGMEDPPVRQVNENGHAVVSLLDAELVDTDVIDSVERNRPVESLEFGSMDVLIHSQPT